MFSGPMAFSVELIDIAQTDDAKTADDLQLLSPRALYEGVFWKVQNRCSPASSI